MGGRPAPTVESVRRARHKSEVVRLDYLRGLLELSDSMTQVELANQMGLRQPSISSSLKTARRVGEIRDGFSGASPYEIAERYVAGELSREQTIDELSRWPYTPVPLADPTEALIAVPHGGTIDDLSRVRREGLIDDEMYDEIVRRWAKN